MLLPVCELGLSHQTIVAHLLLDLVESGDRMQGLVGLLRLDISGVKDFSTRVSPALCMRDSRLVRVLRIGAIAVALQYGPMRPVQAKHGLNVLGRPAGVVQEADFVLFSHDWPEVGRFYLARPGTPGLDQRFVHRDHAPG